MIAARTRHLLAGLGRLSPRDFTTFNPSRGTDPRHHLGRELPREQRARPRHDGEAVSRRDARGHRRRSSRAPGRPGGGAHRHPGPAGTRPDRGRPGQHRRPHLVGPRHPRRGRRRRGRPGLLPSARRDGPAAAALGALLQDLHQADGHLLLAGLAQLRRHRAGLDGGPRPPDHRGRAVADRHRRAGDVRGVLRHPAARRADLPVHLHRRRGVPLRLHLAARQGPGLLLLTR